MYLALRQPVVALAHLPSPSHACPHAHTRTHICARTHTRTRARAQHATPSPHGKTSYEFSKRRRKAGLPNVFADVRRLRFAARQLMEGLSYIHGFGIIHCDIKPENVLLTDPRAGSLHLKIIDYGSSAYATDKLTLCVRRHSILHSRAVTNCIIRNHNNSAVRREKH